MKNYITYELISFEVSDLNSLMRLQKLGTKKLLYVFFALLVVYITAVPVDSVVIRPGFDAGTVIQWRPVELKNKFAILPGDKLEISFGYYIPAKADNVLIKMSIGKYDLRRESVVPMINKTEYISTDGEEFIWRNITIEVPDYSDKLVASSEISHPWEVNGWDNYMTTEIKIFPDTEIVEVSLPTTVVESESILPIKVKIKSNQIGRGYTLAVEDLNLKDLIAVKHIEITKPEMTVSLDVNVPKASKSEEIHIWRISLNGVDYDEEDNEKTVTLTIRSNNQLSIPGFELISLIVASIIVLQFVRRTKR